MKAVNSLPPEGSVRLAIEKRFWVKVDKRDPDECWPWLAARDRLGYGQFGIAYHILYAHRVAWWLTHGAIPEGMCVCHHCDSSSCMNPAHLFLGTHADNMADKVQKGRQARSKPNAKLTEEDVRAIRKEYATGRITQRGLAQKYGVVHATISHVVVRRTWRHVR